jgi:hypothetical protein
LNSAIALSGLMINFLSSSPASTSSP